MYKYNAKKTASGKYKIQIRLGEKRVQFTAETESEVKRLADRAKAEYVLKGKIAAQNASTLGGIIDDYINSRREILSKSTIVGYENIRKNRFKKYMSMRPEKINFQKMINDEAKVVGAKTIRNGYAVVHSALDYVGFAVPSVRLPTVQKTEHAFLEPDQIPAFLDALRGQPFELPALLGLCSLRRSEIYGLQWQDVDLKKKTMHVCRTVYFPSGNSVSNSEQINATKTVESNRYVPIMIPRLYELLSTGGTGSVVKVEDCGPQRLQRGINRICESLDYPLIGTHGLRHTVASLCYSEGVPAKITMALGGWSTSQVMTDIYTHLAQRDITNASTLLSTFFENC